MSSADDQFERAGRLALKLAGIELAGRHRELLRRRCQRQGIHDAAGLEPVLTGAEQGNAEAAQKFLGLITTKFTGFFREPSHFQIAAEHALRVAGRRGHARLWSAAAATGEEPYSLAMSAIEVFGRDDPPISILATDVNADSLAVARRGEYGEAAVRGIVGGVRERFLLRASARARWSIAPTVRRLVEFRPLNLVDAAWPVVGPLDVIFCRNVLMYLGGAHRCAVLERMRALLAPDGLLMLDPAEHLGKAEHLFTLGVRGVHSPQAASPVPRSGGFPISHAVRN